MSKIKEMYENKGNLYEKMKALAIEIQDTDDTTVAKEKNAEWNKYDEDYKVLVEKIRIAEINEKMIADSAVLVDDPDNKVPQTGKEMVKSKEYVKAFSDFLRTGDKKMEPENQDILSRTNQFYTTDAYGGYTIPEIMGDRILSAKLYFDGMLDKNLTTWLSTSTGATMTFPKVNDTDQSGYVISEKSDLTTSAQDMTFGVTTFGAYKYTSGLVKVSNELLQDSDWDFASWLIDKLAIRFWRGLNTLFTTGSGSSTLEGIVTGATKGEDAAVRTITRDDFLNLYHSVDIVYRNSPFCRWMLNDSTLKALKAIVQSATYNESPLWQPSMRVGEPDTIEGKAYIVNIDMDDLFPTKKPVLFGDFKQFLIREVLPMKVRRLEELYAATDEVGFVLLGRYDSGSLAAQTSYPIRFIRNATT